MNVAPMEAYLISLLVGPVPGARNSLVKGALAGLVSFGIFEYGSFVNKNIPRIPVAWLFIVFVFAVELVLFMRVTGMLHEPRKENLFFVLNVSYVLRQKIAVEASRAVHRAVLSFMVMALIVASVLEYLILEERSVMMLVIIPVSCMLLLLFVTLISHQLIERRCIPLARNDSSVRERTGTSHSYFAAVLAKRVVSIARSTAQIAPRSVRPLVMRNILYIVHGELFVTLLLLIATPVLLAVFIFMLPEMPTPFRSFFPLLGVFIVNMHHGIAFQEAAEQSNQYPWYHFSRRTIAAANFISLSVLSIPIVLSYVVVSALTLGTVAGLVYAGNFFLALAATIGISCRMVSGFLRKESDISVDLMLFALVALGVFVPWVGGVFSLTAMGIIVLLSWKVLMGKSEVAENLDADEFSPVA